MGSSVITKCEKCGYEAEIILCGYGGIRYYYTYRCNKCHDFFVIVSEEEEITQEVLCPVCKTRDVDNITLDDELILEDSPDELNIRCPKCNGRFIGYEDFIDFDD